LLVLACACAIDEEFDEEHAKKRKEANAEWKCGHRILNVVQ
jgi:hypothetical protein